MSRYRNVDGRLSRESRLPSNSNEDAAYLQRLNYDPASPIINSPDASNNYLYQFSASPDRAKPSDPVRFGYGNSPNNQRVRNPFEQTLPFSLGEMSLDSVPPSQETSITEINDEQNHGIVTLPLPPIESQASDVSPNPGNRSKKVFRILVVGGGPAGLLFSSSVKSLLGDKVDVTVYEHRLTYDKTLQPPSLRWKSKSEGVNRREQVVTLQSAVFSSLPLAVQEAIFVPDTFSYVWPYSGESPPQIGFPRNLKIKSIEDNLLELALNLGVHMHIERANPALIDRHLQDKAFNMLVIADGPASRIRDHYIDKFGRDDPTPFRLPGKPDEKIEDVVLAINVVCHLDDPNTVVLTIMQNRFLLNTKDGEGYLYMRLTRDEAIEVRGRSFNGKRFNGCIQSQPCEMQFQETSDQSGPTVGKKNGYFGCPRHGTFFIPPYDPSSLLWPRVTEGIKLFNCEMKSITVFRLSMTMRPSYVAELTDTGTNPPVFGALIGDAANAIHFWPGRGLNHGIYSAVALARTVHDSVQQFGRRQFMRAADFTRFQAAMSSLQHRHKDRAWRAMVQQTPTDAGKVSAISDIISDAIDNSECLDRQRLLSVMENRVRRFCDSLADRLPLRPNMQDIMTQVRLCNSETLNVFVDSGTWETFLSGGPEVDMDALIPRPSTIPKQMTSPEGQEREQLLQHQFEQNNKNSDLTSTPILSKESQRASFRLACDLNGADTLSWSEAAREIQALFLRANVRHDLTQDEFNDAVENADRDSSDRIDQVEFEMAVDHVRGKLQKKSDQLGDVWTQAFQNAAEASGKASYRVAAQIVSRFASSMRPARPDLTNPGRLKAEFKSRSDRDGMVDVAVFRQIAVLVMFGE